MSDIIWCYHPAVPDKTIARPKRDEREKHAVKKPTRPHIIRPAVQQKDATITIARKGLMAATSLGTPIIAWPTERLLTSPTSRVSPFEAAP